jgi:hypothetical protein
VGGGAVEFRRARVPDLRGRGGGRRAVDPCPGHGRPRRRLDERTERNFERELNTHAARGLRFAATSDGLPCTVAVMQAPERAGAPAAYRVVQERELATALDALIDEGFVPRASARTIGTRHQVVFERTAPTRPPGDWRLLALDKREDLEPALVAAAGAGFQVRLVVRAPFRSWPGLSEKGLVLAMKPPSGPARQARVLVGSNRDLKDVAGALQTATTEGWGLDGLVTSARDGSRDARRERVVLMLSRGPGAAASGGAVSIERHTSFGIFGSGTANGAGLFWSDYLTAWTPRDRHQIWASPIQLSGLEANCVGFEFKMRIDGMNDQAHDIVALLARPRTTDGYELVVVTEQRIGS